VGAGLVVAVVGTEVVGVVVGAVDGGTEVVEAGGVTWARALGQPMARTAAVRRATVAGRQGIVELKSRVVCRRIRPPSRRFWRGNTVGEESRQRMHSQRRLPFTAPAPVTADRKCNLGGEEDRWLVCTAMA